MKIAIGTKNPAKIKAVEDAFREYFKDQELTFIGVDVPSGVSDQPMSDEETLQGALNRARDAQSKVPGADYGVGIEGGVQMINQAWFVGNFACVAKGPDKVGFGISPRVELPVALAELLQQGMDLSAATHEVFAIADIGKKEGILGMLTNGIITRTSASRDAIICAIGSVSKNK